jgi:hypothetical protein
MLRTEISSVNFLVGFVTAHLADSVLKHCVLLEEVVNGFLALSVVMHGGFEEEGKETLNAALDRLSELDCKAKHY